ncbi:hypothetical protein SCLCIDRAFT_44625, partial [Scleroderma citrinum Foug A]
RFTNNDLPMMFLKDRRWSKNMLPTLLLWLGDQPNVWSIPEEDLIHALREITKVIFPKFTDLQDIHPNMPIFSLVSHLALDITILTTDRAFAYNGMKSEDQEKAFRSTFVFQLLANAHLHVCFRSVDVPALQLLVETNRARGAIALCVTAVRC